MFLSDHIYASAPNPATLVPVTRIGFKRIKGRRDVWGTDSQVTVFKVFKKENNYTTRIRVQRRYGETEGGVVEEKKEEIPGGRQ